MEAEARNFVADKERAETLEIGLKLRAIMLQSIPGSERVFKSCREYDKRGVDWWVECSNGKLLAVDTKVREKDYGDVCLESISKITPTGFQPGWAVDENKVTDYILLYWKDTGRSCFIPFPMLLAASKANMEEWKRAYRVDKHHTVGIYDEWDSECVYVPTKEIWKRIYQIATRLCLP